MRGVGGRQLGDAGYTPSKKAGKGDGDEGPRNTHRQRAAAARKPRAPQLFTLRKEGDTVHVHRGSHLWAESWSHLRSMLHEHFGTGGLPDGTDAAAIAAATAESVLRHASEALQLFEALAVKQEIACALIATHPGLRDALFGRPAGCFEIRHGKRGHAFASAQEPAALQALFHAMLACGLEQEAIGMLHLASPRVALQCLAKGPAALHRFKPSKEFEAKWEAVIGRCARAAIRAKDGDALRCVAANASPDLKRVIAKRLVQGSGPEDSIEASPQELAADLAALASSHVEDDPHLALAAVGLAVQLGMDEGIFRQLATALHRSFDEMEEATDEPSTDAHIHLIELASTMGPEAGLFDRLDALASRKKPVVAPEYRSVMLQLRCYVGLPRHLQVKLPVTVRERLVTAREWLAELEHDYSETMREYLQSEFGFVMLPDRLEVSAAVEDPDNPPPWIGAALALSEWESGSFSYEILEITRKRLSLLQARMGKANPALSARVEALLARCDAQQKAIEAFWAPKAKWAVFRIAHRVVNGETGVERPDAIAALETLAAEGGYEELVSALLANLFPRVRHSMQALHQRTLAPGGAAAAALSLKVSLLLDAMPIPSNEDSFRPWFMGILRTKKGRDRLLTLLAASAKLDPDPVGSIGSYVREFIRLAPPPGETARAAHQAALRDALEFCLANPQLNPLELDESGSLRSNQSLIIASLATHPREYLLTLHGLAPAEFGAQWDHLIDLAATASGIREAAGKAAIEQLLALPPGDFVQVCRGILKPLCKMFSKAVAQALKRRDFGAFDALWHSWADLISRFDSTGATRGEITRMRGAVGRGMSRVRLEPDFAWVDTVTNLIQLGLDPVELRQGAEQLVMRMLTVLATGDDAQTAHAKAHASLKKLVEWARAQESDACHELGNLLVAALQPAFMTWRWGMAEGERSVSLILRALAAILPHLDRSQLKAYFKGVFAARFDGELKKH